MFSDALKTNSNNIAKNKIDSFLLIVVTNLSIDSRSKVSSSTVRAANCFHQSIYHLMQQHRYENNLTEYNNNNNRFV